MNFKFYLTFISIISALSGFTQVISTFDASTDNWHSEGDGDYFWEAGTGNPGGCFRVNDDATGGFNNAIAPVGFLGNWSGATSSDFVSADVFVHSINGSYSDETYVFRISGPGGEATALNAIHPTLDVWNTFTVFLDPVNWTILSGTWDGILEDVTDFIVRAEYLNYDEYDMLDNITLSIAPQIIQISPTICSDFEDGTFDSWTIQNSGGVTINATGGNPGKCLRITDDLGSLTSVFPPPKFLGDWTLLDNHNADIRVDLKVTNFTTGILLSSFFVKISGTGGEALIPMDNSVSNAFNRWHTFVFPVDESYWTMTSGTWAGLISSVNSFEIIAEFISNTEIVWLDNFCISNLPPIADFTANKLIEFAGNPISFTDFSANGPNGWIWNFGDTQTSNDQYPFHTYLTDGLYDVSLTANNHFGSGTETKTGYIEILPIDECLKFEDNFDDGTINPLITTLNGTWSESSGRIRQTSNYYVTGSLLGGCYATTGSFLWDNYMIDCDMMSADNDHIGFVFNWQDELNTYMFYWTVDGNSRTISKWINGTETILASESVSYTSNTWYNVKISAIPGNIKLFIDEVLIFDINDNTFTHGKVALFCYMNQGSYWDNFNVSCTGREVDLKVFLEGPFNGTGMNTFLTSLPDFPLLQPYNKMPWNYTGTESVSVIPAGVVDWVLVELRDAVSAATATTATIIARQAGFLMSDGSIRSINGTSSPQFDYLNFQHSLFAVINHRNHLAVISATGLTESGAVISYDFTTAANQAYNNAQQEIGTGIWGMFAGDMNASGLIDSSDKSNFWNVAAGRKGYLNGDADLNTQVENNDKNVYWLPNVGQISQVPD